MSSGDGRISAGDTTEPTRERLLDAGEELFARNGFDPTSVREITTLAGCNVAAVNYHFGGKASLYREVFRRRLGALREQRISSLELVLAEAGEQATLELVLRTFTTAFLEPLVGRSYGRLLMQLIGQEMQNPHLPHQVFLDEMVRPVKQALISAVLKVCPELDPAALPLSVQSVMAQLVYVVHARRMFADSDEDGLAGRDLGVVVDHIVQFSAAGIRSLPRESS